MATTSINCCLNVSPPNHSPPSTLPKPTVSPCKWQPGDPCSRPATATATAARKDAGWKSRCVSTVACVILGSAVGLTEVESFAYAAEGLPAATAAGARATRWSDVRECPPWRANSLENIMPENLPRPSARRRLESVRITRSAPAVAGHSFGLGRGSCYSL